MKNKKTIFFFIFSILYCTSLSPMSTFIKGLDEDIENIRYKDKEKSDTEPSSEFYERYGRNIALCVDEFGSELMSKDVSHTAVRDSLLNLLQSKVSIIVTNLDVWKKLAQNPKLQVSFLDYWDIYLNSFNVLVFIPKVLESQAKIKNQLIGIDLTFFNKIKSSQLMQVRSQLKTDMLTFFPLFYSLKNLLISKTEDYNIRPWTIYLTGHGTSDTISTVCSWLLPYFNLFLEQLNTNFNVKILVFDSCHAGSRQVMVEFFNTKRYNFPIVCPGLFDSPIFGCGIPNYKKFFESLHSIRSFNTIDDLQQVRWALQNIESDSFKNTLRVRKAGSDKFELVPDNETVVTVSALLTKQCTPHLSYCVYLLDRPVFTDTLIFDRATSIVTSALPGQANHYLRHVRMPQVKDAGELFRYFMRAQSKDQRLYMIDVFEGQGSLKLQNVVVVNNNEPFIDENQGKKHTLFWAQNKKVLLSVSLAHDTEPFEDTKGKEQDVSYHCTCSATRYMDFYTRTKAALLANLEFIPEITPTGDETDDYTISENIFSPPKAIKQHLLLETATNAYIHGKLLKKHMYSEKSKFT